MKLDTAIYHAVHDYPAGVDALAALMGIAGSTLQSMANPRITTHGWSKKHLMQLIELTGDMRVVDAFCAEFGGVFLPAGGGLAGQGDVFRRVSAAAKEFGEVVAEIEAAVADGRVTQTERDRVHQQIYELSRAAFALGQHVDGLAEAKGGLKVAK